MQKTCDLIRGQIPKAENKDLVVNNFWYRAETPAVMATCHPFMIGFALLDKYFPEVYKTVIVICGSGYFWFYANEEDSLAVGKMLYEGFLKDENFIYKKQDAWRKDLKKLHELGKKIYQTDLSKMTNKQLAKIYDGFINAFYEAWTIPLILEMNTVYVEQVLAPRLGKSLKLPKEKFNEVLAVMSQPLQLSYLTIERIDFLKLASDFSQNKLSAHQQKYYWVKSSYRRKGDYNEAEIHKLVDDELSKGKNHVKNELAQLLKLPKEVEKRQRELTGKYRISTSDQKLFRAMAVLGDWQDKRKEMNIFGNHHIFVLIDEVARRFDLDIDLVAHAFPSEVLGVLEGKMKFDEKELTERFKFGYHAINTNLEEIFLVGRDAEDLKKILDKKIEERFKEIKGMVASMGKLAHTKGQVKVVGKVRVVLDPYGADIPQGTILVTPMTRPDFIHLISKAAAIITDQGGVTSHAAIVSREFGIPCIVGTGNATKLLKDGDEVAVDTQSGVVIKL